MSKPPAKKYSALQDNSTQAFFSQTLKMLEPEYLKPYTKFFSDYIFTPIEEIIPVYHEEDDDEDKTPDTKEDKKNKNSKGELAKENLSPGKHSIEFLPDNSYKTFSKFRDEFVKKLQAFQFAPRSQQRLNDLDTPLQRLKGCLEADKKHIENLIYLNPKDFSLDEVQAATQCISTIIKQLDYDKYAEIHREAQLQARDR